MKRLLSITAALVILTGCAMPPAPAAPMATPAPEPTAAPTVAPEPTIAPTIAPVVEAPAANLTEGCVQTYDPNVDYFPEKVVLEDATGFKVEYANNYKTVTVLNPWRDAKEQFTYVLVQCGTPAPTNVGNALVLEVPAKTVIAMSTTQLPHLEKLGILDKLIGLDSFLYVNNPAVREMAKANKLVEIGFGSEVNVEKTIEADPDVVMTYGSGDPQYDAHPKLLEAKISTVINAEYMEESPLGRAEWIKFTSLLFNRESMAQDAFAAMKQRYNDVAAKVKDAPTRPTVISGMADKDSWFVPGGKSFAARLMADAGAAYLWADDTSTGSLPLTFEAVFDKSAKADVWLLNAFGTFTSTASIIAAEPRYAEMAAVKSGNVWNNDKRVNENGGNDYWETGVGNPDILLADLAKIFHPELMADHEFVFWRKLESK